MGRALVLRVVLMLCCLLWGVAARAQQPTDEQMPKPAARSIPAINEANDQQDGDKMQDPGSNWRPDTTPLTGLEKPSLGNPNLRHSYWVPGLEYGATMQSGPLGSSSTGGWYATNYLGGDLSLLKAWSHSILALNYSGGGVITTQSGQDNGWFQQVAVGQNLQVRRWQWQWSDQFTYLPESQFGFGAGTGLGFAGIGGTLAPSSPGTFQPNQSILTAAGPRYSNVAVVQGTYLLSPRQSITVGGMDGLLHFTQTQNIDSANYLGSIGYNYALTKEDSIGLMYRFSAYHFQGQPQAYGDSSIGVAYGRKITRRLALQAFGGPDFITYRVPTNGKSSQLSAMGTVNLIYAFKPGSISASYYHGISGGSGALIGGELDQITLNASRQVTRLWSANANFGYASNRTLPGSSSTGYASYDNYFVGGGVSRPFGRNISFSVAYVAYIERPNQKGCTGPNCNATTTQNSITVFLQWHARPFVLE